MSDQPPEQKNSLQTKDISMDEKLLHTLISKGENESVDFKRELKLENADEKAELIKDIISLANSAVEKGYLIIGVDNMSDSIGINRLEEERIQQIAHTYIYPSIVLRCHLVYLDSKLIGVLEIKATNKPHQVIRSIDRLSMNDVFVRHGSIVAKASPDEMFRMREKETEIQREIRQFAEAAERHLKIGNIDQAIKAYTKGIELTPTVELLLGRARTYKYFFQAAESYLQGWVDDDVAKSALKDFSNALILADSDEMKKGIRLERMELLSMSDKVADNVWDKEFPWALENTQDEGYGQIMFFAARRMLIYWESERWDNDLVIEHLSIALKLGFEDAKVYYIRALAHFWNNNFGLALKDINMAINMIKGEPYMCDCLNLRISILQKIGSFQEAYDDLVERSKIPDDALIFNWLSSPGSLNFLTHEIYQRVVLGWKFKNYSEPKDIGTYQFILRLLILNESRRRYMLDKDGNPREYGHGNALEKEMPRIAPILREIVGEDIWQAAKQGKAYKVNFVLESDIQGS